jgi:hypothetical protein
MVGFFNFGSFGGGSVVGGGTIIDSSGSIPATVGSTKTIDITCNQTVTSLTLLFVVETMRGVDVATVSNDSITKDGTIARLSLTSAMTTVERTLRWSVVNTANGEAVAAGLMFITYDAQGDS